MEHDQPCGDRVRPLLSPEQLAERLDFDVSTVRRWCREGKLPAFRLNGYWRVTEEDLGRFLREAARG